MIKLRDITALILGSIIWFAGVITYGALLPVIVREPIYHSIILIYINYVLRYILPYLLINFISGIVAGVISSKGKGIIVAGTIPIFMISFFYLIAGIEVLNIYLSLWYIPWLWIMFALLGGYIGWKLKQKILQAGP